MNNILPSEKIRNNSNHYDVCMRLPSVDMLLNSDAFKPLLRRYGRMVVRNAIRELQSHQRRFDGSTVHDLEGYAQLVEETLENALGRRGAAVFNMTGVLLHSNLGRAQLDPEIAAGAIRSASGPVLLEMDARTGKRGDRETSIAASLMALTDAEGAAVVNNNAAAVMLMLAVLRQRSRNQIIVSRGELVEIGGSFRLPDIMRAAGVRLIEVGTTNVTRARDYADAISEKTAALLKVHTSNYRIAGYSKDATLQELAPIAEAAGVPLCMDLGSGALIDMTQFGLPSEPRVSDALGQGAKLVTFSGDKLLGSVQAGILLGNRDLIARINRHPMKRALRLDKLRLALLQESLKAYQDSSRIAARVPLIRQLARGIPELRDVAKDFKDALAPLLETGFTCQVVPSDCEMGSGSMPGAQIPSVAVEIRAPSQAALKRFDVKLRCLPIPVIGRIHARSLLLDVRTIEDPKPLVNNLQHLSTP